VQRRLPRLRRPLAPHPPGHRLLEPLLLRAQRRAPSPLPQRLRLRVRHLLLLLLLLLRRHRAQRLAGLSLQHLPEEVRS